MQIPSRRPHHVLVLPLVGVQQGEEVRHRILGAAGQEGLDVSLGLTDLERRQEIFFQVGIFLKNSFKDFLYFCKAGIAVLLELGKVRLQALNLNGKGVGLNCLCCLLALLMLLVPLDHFHLFTEL